MANIPATLPIDNTVCAPVQRSEDTFRIPNWAVRSQLISAVWSQGTSQSDTSSARPKKGVAPGRSAPVFLAQYQSKDPIDVLSSPAPVFEDDHDVLVRDSASDREEHSEGVRRARLLQKLQSEAGGKSVIQVGIVSGSITPNAFRAISTALFRCSERSYNRVFYFRPGEVCRKLRGICPSGSVSGSDTQSLEAAFVALANVRIKITLTPEAGEVSREQRRLLETETPLVSWMTTSRLSRHSVSQLPISVSDLGEASRRRTWTIQLTTYGEILMLLAAYGQCSHSAYSKLKRTPFVRWVSMFMSTQGHSASGNPFVTRRPTTLLADSGLVRTLDEASFLVSCRAGVLSPDEPNNGQHLRRRARNIQRKCRMLHESTKQIAAVAGFAFSGLRDTSINCALNFLRPPHEGIGDGTPYPDKELQPAVEALSAIERTCLESLSVNPRSSYQRQASTFLQRLGRSWSEEFLHLKARLDELIEAPAPTRIDSSGVWLSRLSLCPYTRRSAPKRGHDYPLP